jgi:hypothetical protein
MSINTIFIRFTSPKTPESIPAGFDRLFYEKTQEQCQRIAARHLTSLRRDQESHTPLDKCMQESMDFYNSMKNAP